MKHALLLCLVISIAGISCIKPERDNEYDPNNPCKAYVSGIVYGHDGVMRIADANIALILDGEIMYEVNSDINGEYHLEEIDPGIYRVEVKAHGYMMYTDTADLWAGREEDSSDIYLEELFFDFEDILENTPEPYRFQIVHGEWGVIQVPLETNQAYAGAMRDTIDEAIVTLNFDFRDFYADVRVQLIGSSTGYPGAFLMVKYQDAGNFYWIGIGPDYIKIYKRENWIPIMVYENHGVNFHYEQWYELQVEIIGNTFHVTVPGVVNFQVSDTGWASGSIGFYLMNWDGLGFETYALFDDLYIDTRKH